MIYFLIYLFLEVFISLQFAEYLGAGFTFLEIIVSAIIGLFILANFRNGAVENLMRLKRGEISNEQFAALNLFKIVGAILLLIPGFLTDIVGILFQFSSLGVPLSALFMKKGTYTTKRDQKSKYEDDIIDVEVIEKKGEH